MPTFESWPYIIVGAALHVGYQLFLSKAYQIADYSVVYPLARGTAPLHIAAAMFLFFETSMSLNDALPTLIIAAGIICLAGTQRGPHSNTSAKGLMVALFTGLFIAAYSVIDGVGAIKAETALGFYAWLTLSNAVFMYVLQVSKNNSFTAPTIEWRSRIFWLGGFASFTAYAITIWAFTVAPIALVSAVRETSIIFALFLGHFLLKEKATPASLLSIVIITAGLAFSRIP